MTKKTEGFYNQIQLILDNAKETLSTKEYMELCEEVEDNADDRYQGAEPTAEEDYFEEEEDDYNPMIREDD